MLTCPNPSCRKPLPELTRTCSFCQADLSLLVDYAGHLGDALSRAEVLTRAGELGKAIWAYLEVLEIDPDNPSARRQVGQVATAVRVFDQVAVGRRWRDRLRTYAGFSDDSGWLTGWWTVALMLVLVAVAFLVGYQWGAITH